MAPNLSEKRTPAKLATSLASAQTEAPYYGSRRMTASLQREGFAINRKRVQRLMRQMGIMGVAPDEALCYRTPDECYTSALCGADFKLELLSRSPAEMLPAPEQPNACVNP